MQTKETASSALPCLAKTTAPASAGSPSNGDPLLNEGEAAKYLSISPKTLTIWRCTGRHQLSFVKLGRSVRYRRSELDRFIAARTQSPGGAE